jgi:hypothetical protein
VTFYPIYSLLLPRIIQEAYRRCVNVLFCRKALKKITSLSHGLEFSEPRIMNISKPALTEEASPIFTATYPLYESTDREISQALANCASESSQRK